MCYIPPFSSVSNYEFVGFFFFVYIYISSAGERKTLCRKFFCGCDLQRNATDTTDTRSAAGMHKSILWADNLISLSRHLRKECKMCKEGRVPGGRRCPPVAPGSVVAICQSPQIIFWHWLVTQITMSFYTVLSLWYEIELPQSVQGHFLGLDVLSISLQKRKITHLFTLFSLKIHSLDKQCFSPQTSS